jgi:uncharacterized protein (TIGR03083 family)
MTNLADQVIAALRSGHDDLSAYAEKLDEKDLRAPSGASDWEVSQVLSHLGSGAEIGLAALERALSGGGGAPDGFNQSVWDRWNAMPALEHRDRFLEANRRLVERYESLDAQTREDLRIDLGFMPAPVDVATAGRMRLMEFTLHTWDVKICAQPGTTLAPQAVPLLLETAAGLLGWTAKPAALGGRKASLAVDLDDRSLGLNLGDQVSVGERPDQPDGELRTPSEAWLRLVSGRLAPERTPEAVEISGPISLDDLRQVFPGY